MKRFLALLATGAFVGLGLSTSAFAQSRQIGAGGLVLDDYHGHKVTIQAPVFGSPEWNAWSAGGFAPLSWSVPVPPSNNAQSGFLYSGPLTPTVGPYPTTHVMTYWLHPNETGFNNTGGSAGAWDYATTTQLGLVTNIGGTTNVLSKFDGSGGLLNSSITDNGTTVSTTENISANGLVLPGPTSTLQFVDGNQAAGKFLMSDGSGNASWSNALVTTITGTANQVLANGTVGIAQSGPVTLTTPQDIATASSPTFNNLTLNGLTASLPVKTNASKQLVSAAINLSTSDITGTLAVANGGTGSATAPASGQIPVGNAGGTAYAPQTLGGDIATVSAAGNVQLITTGVTAGSYGDATHYPTFTVDAKGRLTLAGQQLTSGALTTNHIFVGNATNVATDVTMGGDATMVYNGVGPTGVVSVNSVQTAAGSSIATAINSNGANLINGDNITHDATLTVAANQLGINLGNSNTWTADQLLPASATQGNNLVSAINAGTTAVGVANGGTGTTTQFTAGSVVFAGASGVYNQDNSNFFWDAASQRLGIRTNAPATALDVNGDITGENDVYSNGAVGFTATAGGLSALTDITTSTGNVNALGGTVQAGQVGTAAGALTLADQASASYASVVLATQAVGGHTYTIPDAGANADFVMTEGAQTINGNKTLSGTTNLSGLTESRPLELDGSNNIVSNLLDVSDNTNTITGTLPVANGGTNSATALGNGKVMVSSGGAIIEAANVTSDGTDLSTTGNITTTGAGNIRATGTGQISSVGAPVNNNIGTTVPAFVAGDATHQGQIALNDGTSGRSLILRAGNIGVTGSQYVAFPDPGQTAKVPLLFSGGSGANMFFSALPNSGGHTYDMPDAGVATGAKIPGFTAAATVGGVPYVSATAGNSYAIATSANFTWDNATGTLTETGNAVLGTAGAGTSTTTINVGTTSGNLNITGLTADAAPTQMLTLDASNHTHTTTLSGTALEGVVYTGGAYRLGGTTNTTNPFLGSRFVNLDASTLTFTSNGGAINAVQIAGGVSPLVTSLAPINLGNNTTQGVLRLNDGSGTFYTVAPSLGALEVNNNLRALGYMNAQSGFRVNGSASTGTVLRGDGTNYVASTTTWPNAATTGDLLVATGANAYGNLAVGGAHTVIHGGATPTYGAVDLAAATSDVTGILPIANGGTNTSTAPNANAIVLGDGTGAAYTSMGSTGTTTTLLHGNASGAPTFGAVDLTADVSNVLPIANGGTNSGAALNNNRVMVSSGGAIVEAAALTNGQLLIGSTGAAPVAAGITGTTNQVNVATGAGSITLSTPQDIATTSAPTFASMSLTNTTNQLTLGTTNTTTVNAAAPAASATYTIPDVGATADFVMTEGAQTINGNKTLSGTTNLSGLTASLPLHLDGSKNITSGAIDLNSTDVTNILPIANGGTNTSTAPNANAIVLGDGTGAAYTSMGSTGTTTTLLHGNASGAPTFGAVDLTADVSNILPEANGGTGASSFTQGSVVFAGASALTEDNTNLFWDATNQRLGVGTNAPAVQLDVAGSIAGGDAITAVNDITSIAGNVTAAGSVTSQGGTLASGVSNVTPGTVVLYNAGTANSATVTSAPQGSGNNLYTIPDAGLNANFVMTEGAQTINGNKTLSGTTNLSGLTASRPLELDGSNNIVSNLLNVSDNTNTITGVMNIANGGTNTSTAPNANAIVLGDGTGAAYTSMGSTGTTTTLLHGNASGAPTFGAVDLTADVSNVLPIANGGTNSGAALNNNRVMVSSGGAIVEAAALTNGQLLIGSTGAAPVAAGITGTTNQVNVATGAGSITLSTPQDIATTSAPTFASMSLTNTTNQLATGAAGHVGTINVAAPTGATATYTVPDVGNASFVMTEGAQTINGNKTLSGTTNLSSLTASRPLSIDASKNITSGLLNLSDNTNTVTGVTNVVNGGTGAATLTQNGVVYGNGTGAVGITAEGGTNTLLHGNTGGAPTYSGVATADIINSNVTYAKLQNETNATILGNNSGGAAAPSELTLGSSLTFPTATSINTIQDIQTSASPTFTGLTLSGVNTGGLVQTNGSGVVSNGNLSGDVTTSGSLAATVVKINGANLGTTTATSGNILVADGANAWQSVAMTGDVTISNAGATTIGVNKVTSSMINDGDIVNADISASAAIDFSKLATLASGHIIAGNAGVASDVLMSGDVAIDNTGATTIGKLQGQTLDVTTTPPTDKQVLQWNNGTSTWVPGTVDFTTLAGGTNTTSTFTVGSGSQLTWSGTGEVDATHLNTTLDNATNASFYPLFVASTTNGNQIAKVADGYSFNPSTNGLTLGTSSASGSLSIMDGALNEGAITYNQATTGFNLAGDATVQGTLAVNGIGDGAITVANGGLTSGTLGSNGGSVTLLEGTPAGVSTGATLYLSTQGDADLDGNGSYETAEPPALNVGTALTGGDIALFDASGSGYRGILSTSTLTADRHIEIPDVTGSFLAVTSQSNYTDFVALQPGGLTPTAQTMANLPGSVGMYINTPAGGGDLMRLQVNAIDAVVVGNTGQLTLTQGNLQVSTPSAGSLISFDGNVGNIGLAIEDVAGSSTYGVGDLGLTVGLTSHPDIASHFAGLSTDLELSGTSYSDIPGTSIHGIALVFNGNNGDPTGTPTAIPAISNANGTYESGADLAGKSTEVTSYGLRTAGNGSTTDGNTNSALWIKSGELNIARQATTAASNGGTNLIQEDDATAAHSGPSGVVDLSAITAPGGGGNTTGTLTVHNVYANSTSIILLTILNTDDVNFDPTNETASATVEARGAGVFDIRVSRTSGPGSAGGNWTPRVGFMVINASK